MIAGWSINIISIIPPPTKRPRKKLMYKNDPSLRQSRNLRTDPSKDYSIQQVRVSLTHPRFFCASHHRPFIYRMPPVHRYTVAFMNNDGSAVRRLVPVAECEWNQYWNHHHLLGEEANVMICRTGHQVRGSCISCMTFIGRLTDIAVIWLEAPPMITQLKLVHRF